MCIVENFKKIKKISKKVLTYEEVYNIMYLALRTERKTKKASDGVWLSLARAPDLGSGGRRFESCHPDAKPLRV